MGEPRLSLVVSTIGRPVEFLRLLQSIEASEGAEHIELVLVDQSPDQGCASALAQHRGQISSLATTSGRGAAHGRNVGLKLAGAPVVGFPDDNCWYPPGTLRQVLEHIGDRPSLAGVSGRQLTLDRRPSMLRWKRTRTQVTRWNFLHTSIMSTMFFSRAALDSAGPFDETMGVGSSGWYGAGEESDLLLRILGQGGRVDYEPDVVVLQDETRDDEDPSFVAKMLRYGCGMGRLWRMHRLSRVQLGYYAGRKAAAVVIRRARGQRILARADAAYLRGLYAGVTDRPPREWRAQHSRSSS